MLCPYGRETILVPYNRRVHGAVGYTDSAASADTNGSNIGQSNSILLYALCRPPLHNVLFVLQY